ncbi:hypothetical protein GOBAR_DD33539 [Gossypium barbadense]|nr:hypothetical protein GOBAR_DD33539 [Gossypium barbadense]
MIFKYSVKNIQICRPQESNSPRSKTDFSTSNKVHRATLSRAKHFEEAADSQSENALVEKLNDERNWRKGLRPKPILKTRKSEFEAILNEEDFKNSFQSNNVESTENKTEDIGVGSKKGGGKGRGKGRGRVQNHNRRGQLRTSPQPINPTTQCEASMKQTFKGPRIPDGTKGFTMGRGKPLTSYLE